MVYRLLTSNVKLEKSDGLTRKTEVVGLSLAPFNFAGVGNVCAHAGKCVDVCVLWFSGRTVTKTVRAAAIRRTKQFMQNRQAFLADLLHDIAKVQRKALADPSVRQCIRLNVASDIDWALLAPEIFAIAPDVVFYDYSKDIKRAERYGRGEFPANYHISYSLNEKTDVSRMSGLLALGVNVIAVFDTVYRPAHGRIDALPTRKQVKGWRFSVGVDGDKHDVRIPEEDGKGKIVALRGKGGMRRVSDGVDSGFILKTSGGCADLYRAAMVKINSKLVAA